LLTFKHVLTNETAVVGAAVLVDAVRTLTVAVAVAIAQRIVIAFTMAA
jgi:hypothetical protein